MFTAAQFFLFGWFFLSRYPTALTSQRSWGLEGNLSFLFQCLGSTHDLLQSSKEIRSLLQLCCLYHSKLWLTPLYWAVLSAHPIGLASSICWVLLLQLGFTDSLTYALFIGPSLSCSSWHRHAFKTSTTWVILTWDQVQLQHKVQSWLSLEHSFYVLSENTS